MLEISILICRSTAGSATARVRAWVYLVMGILFLGGGIGVTVSHSKILDLSGNGYPVPLQGNQLREVSIKSWIYLVLGILFLYSRIRVTVSQCSSSDFYGINGYYVPGGGVGVILNDKKLFR